LLLCVPEPAEAPDLATGVERARAAAEEVRAVAHE
jgi:hypothetical protein